MKHTVVRLSAIFGSAITALVGLGVLFYGAHTSLAQLPSQSVDRAFQSTTSPETSELEDQGWKNVGLYGGTVIQAAFDPTKDDIYLGVSGGYYKSADGGDSWTRLIEPDGNGTVAVDPVSGTIYLGVQDQVWMSNDGGETWDVESSLEGIAYSMALDPNDGQAAFIGTAGGNVEVHTNGYVHRTLDGGRTWITSPVDPGFSICSVAVDPNNSNYVWAVSGGRCNSTFPDHTAVFSSTDRGLNYSLVLTSTNGYEFQQVAFGPTGVLYLVGEGARVSHNGGITFTVPTLVGQVWMDFFPIAINPTNGRAHLPTFSGGYYSDDGGLSWHWDGLPKVYAIDPENPLRMLGHSGVGLVRSTNGGVSWQDANSGICQVIVQHVKGNPQYTQTLYASTHRGFARSLDGGETWDFPVLDASTRGVAVNPADASDVYAGDGGMAYFHYSTDSGDTWGMSAITISNASVNAVAVDRIVSSTIYAGLSTHSNDPGGDTSRDGVFISYDNGSTWEFFGLAGEQINDLVAVTDTLGSVVYAATGDTSVSSSTGGVYRWKTGETGWTLMGKDDAIVNALAVDPFDPTHLYCAVGQYGPGVIVKGIFESFDSGENWSPVSLGESPDVGRSVHFDPVNSNIVYAGEQHALYRTMDGGDTWTKLSQITQGNGFYSIYLSPDPYRTIYVAMHDGAYYQHEFWVYLPLVMK